MNVVIFGATGMVGRGVLPSPQPRRSLRETPT